MTSSIHRAALRAALRPVVEGLELRKLLSVDISYGTWTVRGDEDGRNLNDSIFVDYADRAGLRLRAVIGGKVVGEVNVADVSTLRVEAGNGNDRVRFGALPEAPGFSIHVSGGAGDDTLSGTAGRDSLSGNEGDDVLKGGRGGDEASGGNGDDVLHGRQGDDNLDGGGGDDRIYGGSGIDVIEGRGDDDHLWGGSGDDQLIGGDGRDRIAGAAGSDTIAGGIGRDRLRGGGDADQIHGGYDDDGIEGMKGKDTLWGGVGRDALAGGAEGDTVYHEKRDKPKWDKWDVRKNEQLVKRMMRHDEASTITKRLINEAVARWEGRLGSSYTPWGQWRAYERGDDGNLVLTDAQTDFGGAVCGVYLFRGEWVSSDLCGPAAGPDYSGTNTQEADVDEADLVKTDGQYLYLLEGNDLVILDAWPADQTRVVSRTTIEGSPEGLYLDGDRVTVISSGYTESDACIGVDDGEIEDGESCELNLRWSQTVTVAHYDVSDRDDPKLTEKTEIDGTLNTSRGVDGRLYLVVGNSMDLPGPRRTWHEVPTVPDDSDEDAIKPVKDANGNEIYGVVPEQMWDGRVVQVRGYFLYETEAEYRARLEEMSLADLSPGYRVTDGDGEVTQGSLSVAGSYYTGDDERDPQSDWWNMFSVVLIDPEAGDEGPDAVTSVVGMNGTVYASSKSLYVTASEWDVPMGDWRGEYRTDMYKFDLGTDSIPLSASGQVPGWTLNSFSMDEEGEHFRIATTSDGGNGTSNNVFVVREDGGALTVAGGITGLAFSERIYSARFIGDRGYLVTFRQIDPLFTIDLSDPAAPSVAGELKIPGYSSYLHPVGENLLLGVGRDADPETGLAFGLQVSLFDVSDFENPKRVDVETFGTGRWEGRSPAEYDHHAFAYFEAQGILALPVTHAGDGSGRVYKTVLLKVDAAQGLTEVGRVEHDKEVWRNVRIGEFLYSIGAAGIKVVPLADADDVVAEVAFGG